jgi:integrase/recombinase XerD
LQAVEVLRTGAEARADRVRKRLDKVLATIQMSGHRPMWVDAFVARKRLKDLNDTTILRYLEDLQCFELDPAVMSSEDIEKRLALLSRMIKKASYRRTVITVKQVLKHLDREEEADEIPLPKKPEPRIALLTKEELEKLLAACTNIRDRLLVQFLIEMGSRRGEIAGLRIKDIQFDQYTPIVWLRGKTGERRRRVYVSKPDLLRYLEVHPYKTNPNAPFWVTMRNPHPLQYEGIYKIISKLGWRTLHRQIYPHMFRHTAATHDSKRFTDTEMMIRHGWKTAEQVRVYSHISMRDVDDHDLVLHGIKPASEAAEPLIEIRHCHKCQAENAPVAIYCQSCGTPLNQTDVSGENEQLRGDLEKVSRDLAALRTEFETSRKMKITDTNG